MPAMLGIKLCYPRQNAGHVLFFETFACPIAHPTALEHCFVAVSSAEIL